MAENSQDIVKAHNAFAVRSVNAHDASAVRSVNAHNAFAVRLPAIEVDGISKRFGTLQAVDNVSFQVPAGEIFGLLGPNGAGKSTLIRMLTTLVPPTSGTAIVAGHDIIREPDAVRINIGVIPQNMTSDPELTCAENVGIHARLYGITGARRRQRTAELLAAVGLGDRANALASTLSGGMRRRLEIARGIVHNPKILFLDEPTTGLDPVSRMSVWEMITHLRAQEGRTLFLTTHYMDEADRLCDRVAIVDQGRIAALDTPLALKGSVPGASRIDVQFAPDLPNGAADLERLPSVQSVSALGSAAYRISSDRGPASAQEVVELARECKLELKSLSVQSTSLDDVFLHYTGRALAEGADAPTPSAKAGFTEPRAPASGELPSSREKKGEPQ
jgi:ABC-2 type transport system ATP-binding protein